MRVPQDDSPSFLSPSPPSLLPFPLSVWNAVLSFIDLVEFIFTIPGVTVFLSNRICQDPLENFFGMQRQRGRVNENPNVSEFMKNTQALRVVNASSSTIKGNCRGVQKRKTPLEVENTPLQKRKTKHK